MDASTSRTGGLRSLGTQKPVGGFGPNATQPALVSVITVSYNAAAFIQRAINSVRRLEYPNFEYIVIDGASQDGTVAILEQNNAVIDYWISEPDGGIYDAMNKGIEVARGHYLYFLGADDELLEIPQELSLRQYGLVCGNVDCQAKIFRAIDSETLRSRIRFRNAIHPQGTFYSRNDIRYDAGYRLCADYIFNIKHLQRADSYLGLDRTIAIFHPGGASAGWTAKVEVIRIALKHFGFMAAVKSCAYHAGSWIRGCISKRWLLAGQKANAVR